MLYKYFTNFHQSKYTWSVEHHCRKRSVANLHVAFAVLAPVENVVSFKIMSSAFNSFTAISHTLMLLLIASS